MGAAVAVTAWGAGSVIIKAVDLEGLVVAVYRFWLYAVALVVWMRWQGITVDRRVLRKSFLGGLALGLDVALFFSAVKLTSIVNATLIGAMQPVVVSVVAARFFGERTQWQNVAWAAVAMTGVVVVVAGSGGDVDGDRLGDLFAVGALLSWSAYFIFSKRSKGHLTSAEFTLGTAFWSGLINLPLAVGFGQDLSWPSWGIWLQLAALTTLAGVLGHSLMNWSLVRIPLWLGSLFTLLIPVTSSLLAWFFLDEALSLLQVAATTLVIVALGAIVRRQSALRSR